MFKKLKDKLAEEVKSSPQRIQQFAQAAQAAVTSASSSISDITNNDLFSIGDNDPQTSQDKKEQVVSSSIQPNSFQDLSLLEKSTVGNNSELMDFMPTNMNERQRRLSNSSFASDVSFRLPSFESTSMYHLQSDMEVSASEAEERGLSGGAVSLDRVSKEQLYAAYRRTRDRYAKYRTQYADLARHYKLLERENAKAKSVLVETQDKALRRISELKEQSVLEQSAKVHLEKALRIEIEERNLKIESLNTKISLLQNTSQPIPELSHEDKVNKNNKQNEKQLIDLSQDPETLPKSIETTNPEINNLNLKIEKLDQLVNKYKESLKTSKEKNSQLATEVQKLSNELDKQKKENDEFKAMSTKIMEAETKIQGLKEVNEQLENQIKTFDFNKTKELSSLEIDFKNAQEKINELKSKISVFTKREEENAISLAENKLSIHKELESKESEIKSLKDSLSTSNKEIQSLNIVLKDYKRSTSLLEEDKTQLKNEVKELHALKNKVTELENQLQEATQKYVTLEHTKSKTEEDYRCLQLQFKQETAEKLAMIDRNTYLENRNSQLVDENTKKISQLNNLSKEVETLRLEIDGNGHKEKEVEIAKIKNESDSWKLKYDNLESEIQEERVELIKLQTEIEKLLENHERIQRTNVELNLMLSESNSKLELQKSNTNNVKIKFKEFTERIKEFKKIISLLSEEAKSQKLFKTQKIYELNEGLDNVLKHCITYEKYDAIKNNYETVLKERKELETKLKSSETEIVSTMKKIDSLTEQLELLKKQIKEIQSNNTEKDENSSVLKQKYQDCVNKLNVVNAENENLIQKLKENETCYKNLQTTLKLSQNENEKTLDDVNKISNEKLLLNVQLEEIKNDLKNKTEKIKELTENNKQLLKKSSELDNKLVYITSLEENVKTLSETNLSLKSQSEHIAINVKQLQNEIDEIRKSHTELEVEKDRLNSEIEKLEGNQCEHNKICRADNKTQTEEQINEDAAMSELNLLDLLKKDNEAIKEENKRLQSDIEGLQTYLTKVSKENSILNDKLRELIASSETSSDKNDELIDLQTEIQASKEKIQDLSRENTLLVEENLELKDQLQFLNSPSSIDENKTVSLEGSSDYINLEKKYINLLDTKSDLEEKVNDLSDENRSVAMNYNQLQTNNEKLRLSNEKLERRLDEALVSLRHLHSMQNNSELEYLRNILYEYLTGSGTHSLTLAKVLAAVVKFSDAQTQLVLQKEKERQGLLKQLGLL